jgi:hypothetical protein
MPRLNEYLHFGDLNRNRIFDLHQPIYSSD